jgi:hypothetical protein
MIAAQRSSELLAVRVRLLPEAYDGVSVSTMSPSNQERANHGDGYPLGRRVRNLQETVVKELKTGDARKKPNPGTLHQGKKSRRSGEAP